MQVAPSVCDVESLCTSNNLRFRSKHHKISLAWLRNVFTLFKFICSYITKPTTSKDANFATDELCNFPTKFGVKFTTSFRSSWFDWQLRNEIAKFVGNFGTSKQTSEHIRQKLCETLCNKERVTIVKTGENINTNGLVGCKKCISRGEKDAANFNFSVVSCWYIHVLYLISRLKIMQP